jgi:Tol biopolymer transport system component
LPDGKFVAYVTGKDYHEHRLMLQDLKGGPALELAKAANLGFPRWSPDGSEIIVSATFGQGAWSGVILIPRLGGSFRRLGPGHYACWSPDGSQVATAYQPGPVRIIDKATGSIKAIALTGFSFFHDLDWSRASNLLAVETFLAGGKHAIWTVHPDGSGQRKVVEEDLIVSTRWSPAGDEIYFLTGSDVNNLTLAKVAIDLKSGEAKGPQTALLTGLPASYGFTISADGGRLALMRAEVHSNLWLADLQRPRQGNEPQASLLTRGTSYLRSLSISPDGRWLAFFNGQFLFKMPIDGGTPTQLTFSDAEHSGTAWSPDGKSIAFGSREGGTNAVWIVGAEGGTQRQLVNTTASSYTDITWWPGDQILYQKPGNRNYGILDSKTGKENKHATPGRCPRKISSAYFETITVPSMPTASWGMQKYL